MKTRHYLLWRQNSEIIYEVQYLRYVQNIRVFFQINRIRYDQRARHYLLWHQNSEVYSEDHYLTILRITSRWSLFVRAKLPQSCAHVLSSYSRHCYNYQASYVVVVDQPGCVTLANLAQWSEIRTPLLVQLWSNQVFQCFTTCYMLI